MSIIQLSIVRVKNETCKKKKFHILYDIVVSGASINVIIDKLK